MLLISVFLTFWTQVEKIRLAKSLGLDSGFLLTHFQLFGCCKPQKLRERVTLLNDLVPRVKDADLLESPNILLNDIRFDRYYVSWVGREKEIWFLGNGSWLAVLVSVCWWFFILHQEMLVLAF